MQLTSQVTEKMEAAAAAVGAVLGALKSQVLLFKPSTEVHVVPKLLRHAWSWAPLP